MMLTWSVGLCFVTFDNIWLLIRKIYDWCYMVGLKGCSYGGELAQLGELARLDEISPSLRNSY